MVVEDEESCELVAQAVPPLLPVEACQQPRAALVLPEPQPLHPTPDTRNPKPKTRDPRPDTLIPQPGFQRRPHCLNPNR